MIRRRSLAALHSRQAALLLGGLRANAASGSATHHGRLPSFQTRPEEDIGADLDHGVLIWHSRGAVTKFDEGGPGRS